MAWCFEESPNSILFVNLKEKSRSQVSSVSKGPVKYMIKIKLVDGSAEVDIRDFRYKNDLSKKFDGCLMSRSLFVNKFDEVSPESVVETTEEDVDTTAMTSSIAEPEVLPQLSEKTEYLVEKKVLDTVKVHVLNLVPPTTNRLLRPLNTSHVQMLEDSMLKTNNNHFKVLAGVLVAGTLEDAEKEGQCKVEVIGGNHSRAAVTSLFRRGLGPEFMRVRVYSDITDNEALRVGMFHNDVDQQSRQVTFLEKTRLIRSQIEEGGKWKERVRGIFGLESLTKVRNNLKTHIRLAKESEVVWRKIDSIEQIWGEKRPIRQTLFTHFLSLEIDEKKCALLDILQAEGLKAYKEKLSSCVGDKEVTLHKESVVAEVGDEEVALPEDIEETETDNDGSETMREKLQRLEHENRVIKKEKEDIEKKNVQLKDAYDTIKRAFNTLTQRNKEQAKELMVMRNVRAENSMKENTNEAETGMVTAVSKKKRINKEEDATGAPERKKRQGNEICRELKPGDDVEAFWSDWEQWCKAKVIGVIMNGDRVKVRFGDGIVRMMKRQEIRF